MDALQCLPGADRTILWDDALAGFGVAAYPSGRKVYVAQFRLSGRSRRMKLGEHGRLPRLVGQASPPAPVDALAEKTPDRSPFESLIRAFTWTASVALPPRR